MGKKKQKITVGAVVEGEREKFFLEFLKSVYQPESFNIKINLKPENIGLGTADEIIRKAFNECHRSRSFAWLDEDFHFKSPCSKDVLERLAELWNIKCDNKIDALLKCNLGNLQKGFNSGMRNPVLIISQPVVVESLILRVLGCEPCYSKMGNDLKIVEKQGRDLKNTLNSRFNNADELEYYCDNLTQEMLEEKRKTISELDLLISMITP